MPHYGRSVANTIRVTATAGGITRTVDIVIKPAVVGLAVVADHFTFQDAAGAHYALDLTNHAITPAAASLTSDVQVQTTPATPAAWSHVLWGAVDTAAANAIYALTVVDARTRGIRLDGLMTMPPPSEDPEASRPAFEALAALRDRLAADLGLPLPVLSMGMSGDYEVAIAAGATHVRVGTAIFGVRE